MTIKLDGRRPFTLDRSPDLPSGVISLMLPQERDLLFSLAKHYYLGEGDIVDAGIFMGSSTFCFAYGLAASSLVKRAGRIHSYDQAIVTEGMANYPLVKQQLGPAGSNFADYLRATIQPFGSAVDLHLGDITTMSYSGRIEILFLDILKDRSVFRHCNRMFMGSLIPERTVIVQQDYFWFENWYINAYMELLSGYFLVIDSAESSCAFLNVRPIPPHLYEIDPLESLSQEDVLALLDRSREKSSTVFQYVMSELCGVAYAVGIGAIREAKDRLSGVEDRFETSINSWNEGGNRRAWAAHKALAERLRKV